MIPSTVAHVTTIGEHPTPPIGAIVHEAPAPMAVPPAVAPAAPAVVALGGLEGPGACATGDLHVQFRNEPAASADLRRGIEDTSLIISSKNRIKPRTRRPPSTSLRPEYSSDRSQRRRVAVYHPGPPRLPARRFPPATRW